LSGLGGFYMMMYWWPWHVYVGDKWFVSDVTIEVLYIYISMWWFGFCLDVASISWIFAIFACFIALIEIGRYTDHFLKPVVESLL
jgi:hypothetical protein